MVFFLQVLYNELSVNKGAQDYYYRINYEMY